MAIHFIRAPPEGRGTHARRPWSRPATSDVASKRPGAGPAVGEVTWPAVGPRGSRESLAGLPLPVTFLLQWLL
ncbi:hypothetical protein ACRRTK_018341 [Alexandromys fortis]